MASSTEERTLLEAIVAAPDDDAPRLVYADWLGERGDPRGQDIIAQCTLAACLRAGDRTSMRSKVASIYAPGSGQHRGFVDELVVRPDADEPIDFERLGRAYLPGLPLRRVRIEVERDFVTFADLEPVRRIGSPIDELELVCAHGKLAFDARALLAAVNPNFPPRAVIWGNHQVLPVLFTWDHLTRLELGPRSPPFDGLSLRIPATVRHLRMSFYAITPRLLRQVPNLETLEVLEATEEDALEVLAEWPFTRLESLALETHAAENRHVRAYRGVVSNAFLAAGALKTLKHLRASFPIDERMPLESLETLRIAGGARGDVVSRFGEKLYELVVEHVDLAAALAAQAPPSLSALGFVDCTITGDRARRIAESERLARLTELFFTDCRFSASRMRQILSSPVLAAVPCISITPGPLAHESAARGEAWEPPST